MQKTVSKALLENLLSYSNCDFGLWTNGEDLRYLHVFENDFGQPETEELTDFPAADQTLEDMVKEGDRAIPRTPANESLVKTSSAAMITSMAMKDTRKMHSGNC